MTGHTRRLSLPLSAQDERDLQLLRESRSARQQLPEAVAGGSDAALVHAVFAVGLRSVKEQVAFEVYREMATDVDHVREAHANRLRLAQRGRDTTID